MSQFVKQITVQNGIITQATAAQIDSASILPGGVLSGNIGSGQIGTNHLASGAVVAGSIASGSITNTLVASGGFLSGALGSGAVFGPVLAPTGVSSGTLGSGTVMPLITVNLAGQVTSFGTTPMVVQDKGGQEFNILAYGGKGDNSTLNDTAFAAAKTALTAAGGGTIYFPQGYYRFANPITLDGKVPICLKGTGWRATLVGFNSSTWLTNQAQGSVLIFQGATDGVQIDDATFFPFLHAISDLALIGSGTGSGIGINFSSTKGTNFFDTYNVLVANFTTGLGGAASAATAVSDCTFRSLHLWNCVTGWNLANYSDLHFYYIDIQGCTTAALFSGSAGCYFHGGLIQDNTNGLNLVPNATLLTLATLDVRNVWFEANTNYNINFDTSATGSFIQNAAFRSCQMDGSAITFTGRNNSITDLVFEDNHAQAVTLTLPVNVVSARVVNNYFATGSNYASGVQAVWIGATANSSQGGADLCGLLQANTTNSQAVSTTQFVAQGAGTLATGRHVVNIDGASPGIVINVGATGAITTVVLTSNVATLTLSSTQPFQVGQSVTVSGLTHTQFNGTYTLTAVSGATLSYALTGANVTSVADSGTVVSASATGRAVRIFNSGVEKTRINTLGEIRILDGSGNSSLYLAEDGSISQSFNAGTTFADSTTGTDYFLVGLQGTTNSWFVRDMVHARNLVQVTRGGAGTALSTFSDNVTISVASGQTGDPFQVKAGSSVFSRIDASGNVVAPIRDHGGQVFNVQAYGAKGDGVTDDTAAIQATLDAAVNAVGGVAYFPPPANIYNHGNLVIQPGGSSGTGVGFAYLQMVGCGNSANFNYIGSGSKSAITLHGINNTVIEHINVQLDNLHGGNVVVWDLQPTSGAGNSTNVRFQDCSVSLSSSSGNNIGWRIVQSDPADDISNTNGWVWDHCVAANNNMSGGSIGWQLGGQNTLIHRWLDCAGSDLYDYVYCGPLAALTSVSFGAVDTTIYASDITVFPPSGFIQIASELITYTGKTASGFIGCTRGVSGTVATSGNAGQAAFQYLTSPNAGVLGSPGDLHWQGDNVSSVYECFRLNAAPTCITKGRYENGHRFLQTGAGNSAVPFEVTLKGVSLNGFTEPTDNNGVFCLYGAAHLVIAGSTTAQSKNFNNFIVAPSNSTVGSIDITGCDISAFWPLAQVPASWPQDYRGVNLTSGNTSVIYKTVNQKVVPVNTLTDISGTVVADVSTGDKFLLQMTNAVGSGRAFSVMNATPGVGTFFVYLKQPAISSGGCGITTWFSGYTLLWAGGGTSPPTLTSSGGAFDYVEFNQPVSGTFLGTPHLNF